MNTPERRPRPPAPAELDRYLIRGCLRERPRQPRGQLEAVSLTRAAALVSAWSAGHAGQRGGILIDFAFLLRTEPRTLVDVALSFVSPESARAIPERAWWTAERPALAIEVFNAREPREAVTERVREYAACGVRELWVIDPSPGARWLDVLIAGQEPLRLSAHRRLTSATLPGFTSPVAAFFR